MDVYIHLYIYIYIYIFLYLFKYITHTHTHTHTQSVCGFLYGLLYVFWNSTPSPACFLLTFSMDSFQNKSKIDGTPSQIPSLPTWSKVERRQKRYTRNGPISKFKLKKYIYIFLSLWLWHTNQPLGMNQFSNPQNH